MNSHAILNLLQTHLPTLQAVYAFGSQISGNSNEKSDLDLAVLVAGYAEPLHLWDIASELAEITGCPVDLLDFRAASTVIQNQILKNGERWWSNNWQVDAYEAALLNDKLELDGARAALLADIQREGSIHGR